MKVFDFIFAARPMLFLPVWSIYLITCNYQCGASTLSFHLLNILIGLCLMFAGVYYINQIYDYHSDLINKKLGFLQKGMISRNEMLIAYIIVSVLALLIAFYYGYGTGIVFVLIFILGFIYSAPPFRLKDRPMSGILSNSIAYGILIPLTVPEYLNNFSYSTLNIPTYFFLAVSSGYLLTIIPDREGDIKTGKKTLAAIMSDKSLIMTGIVLLALSLLIALSVNHLLLSIISALSIMLFIIALISLKESIILFSCKFPILLISLLAGYYYPLYLVFLLALLIFTRLYYKRRFNMNYPRLN